MKNIFIAMSLATLLAACGGGGSDPASPAPATAVFSQVFTVVTPTTSTTAQGRGATVQDRQKDAAFVVAVNIRPGTADYAALLSDAGLKLSLLDEQKSAVIVTAKLTTAGIVIIF